MDARCCPCSEAFAGVYPELDVAEDVVVSMAATTEDVMRQVAAKLKHVAHVPHGNNPPDGTSPPIYGVNRWPGS